jgi:hypothetical protein
MYKHFFGLRENPFNVNPDPRYLFLTQQTQEALDELTYGIQARKGLILPCPTHMPHSDVLNLVSKDFHDPGDSCKKLATCDRPRSRNSYAKRISQRDCRSHSDSFFQLVGIA